jgi:glyoxylase-like metal-dependent hydrolase (beta-lactamase superfamily II)
MLFLLDTGFTRADALRIAAMVLDSRRTLKTIYISQADPDFYFGIEILKTYFPGARVVATASTVKNIEATLPTKLGVWRAWAPTQRRTFHYPRCWTATRAYLQRFETELHKAPDSAALILAMKSA